MQRYENKLITEFIAIIASKKHLDVMYNLVDECTQNLKNDSIFYDVPDVNLVSRMWTLMYPDPAKIEIDGKYITIKHICKFERKETIVFDRCVFFEYLMYFMENIKVHEKDLDSKIKYITQT
jgi:hypothetical protein